MKNYLIFQPQTLLFSVSIASQYVVLEEVGENTVDGAAIQEVDVSFSSCTKDAIVYVAADIARPMSSVALVLFIVNVDY